MKTDFIACTVDASFSLQGINSEIANSLWGLNETNSNYSRIPITRTFRGNRKRFPLAGVWVTGSWEQMTWKKTMMLCTSIHTMYILIPIWLVPVAGGIFPSEIINNVSHLSGNLLNVLRYYVYKNLSVKPLSSTWITSVFITICSLEIVQFVANLAMITAVRVFRMPFVLW